MPTVPQALLERLHQANARFSEASRRADNLDNMDQKQRAELAAALRAADRELDDVNREIAGILATDNPAITPPPTGDGTPSGQPQA
jgi:hypothetical protein